MAAWLRLRRGAARMDRALLLHQGKLVEGTNLARA
jgi:hypothetical protein